MWIGSPKAAGPHPWQEEMLDLDFVKPGRRRAGPSPFGWNVDLDLPTLDGSLLVEPEGVHVARRGRTPSSCRTLFVVVDQDAEGDGPSPFGWKCGFRNRMPIHHHVGFGSSRRQPNRVDQSGEARDAHPTGRECRISSSSSPIGTRTRKTFHPV
jgi:hypothetical protein